MTRQALLHIGMNKTGTGAIQRTFDGYSDATWVYADLGHPNHSHVLARAFLERPGPRFLVTGNIAAERAAALARLEAAFARDGRSVVVSGEAMSRFGDPGAVGRLLGWMRGHVDEVRVLAYVRDPASFIPSAFQQVLRKSMPPTELEQIAPRYRKRFMEWVKQAGRRKVELVPFDPARLAEGDLLVDFARRVGLSEDHARGHGVRHNDSLSAEATAVLCALRLRMGQKRVPPQYQSANARILQLLASFGSGRFAFSSRALADVLDRQATDIAWIERIMGRALPAPNLEGRRAFDGLDDILDYASTLGPALAGHLERNAVAPAGAAGDPGEMLERLLRRRGPT